MAAEFSLRVKADARDVHKVLRDGMDHVELVSEDVLRNDDVYTGESGGKYIAVLLYQQYFMRVGNQLALMLVISGDSQRASVKSVSCASSKDMLTGFDLGAAGDFASEPVDLLRRHYKERVSEV